MHSCIYYKGEMDRRSADLMRKIIKLAQLRDALQARGRSEDAEKVQARIGRYTIEMGQGPHFVDRYENGTQLIELFGREWEEIADEFTDSQGNMRPGHILRLLTWLSAREGMFACNARKVSCWWIIPNPLGERRYHRQYARLRTYLEMALKRKEVLGITA